MTKELGNLRYVTRMRSSGWAAKTTSDAIRRLGSSKNALAVFKMATLSISKYHFNNKHVLTALHDDDLALFRKYLILKKVKKGKDLFQEGTSPKGVYILKRGRVKLYQRMQNGGEQIIYIYTPGEMFGYRPLLCNVRHPASAMTLEECGIYFLSITAFLATLKRSPALSNILLENLAREFTVLVNRIASFSQKSAKERVALSLLILQETYRRPEAHPVEITLSRADMAAFVGTTNETLARIISKFKKERIIRVVGRKIVIRDMAKLYELAE
jgi:CRP-like cAMP-binding protein